MAAKNPRVHVVLERSLHQALVTLARRSGVSLSLAARDLIREAIELQEDFALGLIAEKRRRGSRAKSLLSHDQMLERLGLV